MLAAAAGYSPHTSDCCEGVQHQQDQTATVLRTIQGGGEIAFERWRSAALPSGSSSTNAAFGDPVYGDLNTFIIVLADCDV
jgi:hypothetical protein